MSYIAIKLWEITYEASAPKSTESLHLLAATPEDALSQFRTVLLGQSPPTSAGANGVVASVVQDGVVWCPE